MPRPRLHATDADKYKAYRERKKNRAVKKATLAEILESIVEVAERRGLIIVENVPIEQKAETLLHFLETASPSQLCIMDTIN